MTSHELGRNLFYQESMKGASDNADIPTLYTLHF